MDDDTFDKIAAAELNALESVLGELDPDELESELSSGVLTLTFADDQKIVINSHRAAGEIWMAAFRTAWHFRPEKNGDGYQWKTAKDELRATLSGLIKKQINKDVAL